MRRNGADFQSALANIVARRNMAIRMRDPETGDTIEFDTPQEAAVFMRLRRQMSGSASTVGRGERRPAREEVEEVEEVEEEEVRPAERRETSGRRRAAGGTPGRAEKRRVDGSKKPEDANWGRILPKSPYKRLYVTLGGMRGIVPANVDLEKLKVEYQEVRPKVEERTAQTPQTKPEAWRTTREGKLVIRPAFRFHLPEFLFRKVGLTPSKAALVAERLKQKGLLAAYRNVPFTDEQKKEAIDLFTLITLLAVPLPFPSEYRLASGTWYRQPGADEEDDLFDFEPGEESEEG